MSASIEIDRDLCMGSGTCILYAPRTFAHDEDTKAIVLDAQGDPMDSIHTAMEACPTSAIKLTDQQGE